MKIINRRSLEQREKIYHLLEKMGYNVPPFSLYRESVWQLNDTYYSLDLVVCRNDKIWLVVDIKENVSHSSLKRMVVNGFDERVKLLGATFGLIVDGDHYLLKDYTIDSDENEFKDVEESALIHFLEDKKNSYAFLNDESLLKFKSDIIELIKEIVGCSDFAEKVIFENERAYFSEKDECSFFKRLLDVEERVVYRYVPFETLFAMLRGKSYRMCGLAGMNDKTEINYFGPNKTDKVENDIYISSCSSLEDNLMMWRLYGDDARGACLVFTIREDYSKKFDIFKVSYAKDKEHREMKLIKDLCDKGFVFRNLKKWKHFFKPKEFENEKEVRLIFTDDYLNISLNRNWVKTNDHSIINPIIDFSLTDEFFPLRLDTIVLGPKFPEKELNKNQLEEMVKSLGLNIHVENSKIECYR